MYIVFEFLTLTSTYFLLMMGSGVYLLLLFLCCCVCLGGVGGIEKRTKR